MQWQVSYIAILVGEASHPGPDIDWNIPMAKRIEQAIANIPIGPALPLAFWFSLDVFGCQTIPEDQKLGFFVRCLEACSGYSGRFLADV